MNRVKQIYLLVMICIATLNAAPARDGLIEYKQPDGTTFEATLHGDGSFHWIEDSQGVILYNREDGYYYRAEVDIKSKKIKRTQTKVTNSSSSYQAKVRESSQRESLSKEQRDLLRDLYRESNKGPHPR